MSDNRNHLDPAYTWDLTTVFVNDAAWEQAYEQLADDILNAKSYAGHLLDSGESLYRITTAYLDLSRRMETLYIYASMKNDEDTTVAYYQELQAKALSLYGQLEEVFAFYEPEFLQLSKETYDLYVEAYPELQSYAHFFEKLFHKKPHVLSEKEEKLLAGATEIFSAPGEVFGILDNADMRFPYVLDGEGKEIELTHGNYISLMESHDREARKGAYEALYSTYEQFQHTYAKTLQSNIKVENFKAKARHYDSARQASLSANAISESVYDSLVESVNRHLPLLHRYIKLRQEILGLDDLKMYDMYVPLSKTDLAYSYDEALVKAEDILAILGEEYKACIHDMFTNRWIDVHVNKGKRSGAYSGGSYDTNAFILLNWQENLDNFYTLVHEAGHSVHSMFTRRNQPYVYGDYSLFLAEIASTTNENIVTETLLQEVSDDKERFAILNHYLDGFRGTVFRQTQFAEFEHLIYQADQAGEVLTSDYLNQAYADLNEKYYGLSKDDNAFIQYEWARIPHFYYNYYVYQYATGFAAASYLADRIVHGKQEDKENYLAYLKAGNSDYPLSVIAKAGVDMTTSDYLDQAFKVFEKRLIELEDLVAKGVHKV